MEGGSVARIRTIKPEFPQSESIGRLSRDARLLFIQLWTVADDHGRARGTPEYLAGQLYPYDKGVLGPLVDWMRELADKGHIVLYEVEGKTYLHIPSWAEHQRVDNAGRSRLPPPPAEEYTGSPQFAANRGEPRLDHDHGPRTETKDLGPLSTPPPVPSPGGGDGTTADLADFPDSELFRLEKRAMTELMPSGREVQWAGLAAFLRVLRIEGIRPPLINAVITTIAEAGTKPNGCKYLINAVRNAHVATTQPSAAGPRPRVGRADSTSDEAVGRRRSAIVEGARALLPGGQRAGEREGSP